MHIDFGGVHRLEIQDTSGMPGKRHWVVRLNGVVLHRGDGRKKAEEMFGLMKAALTERFDAAQEARRQAGTDGSTVIRGHDHA